VIPIRVLIADDSVVYRSQIKVALTNLPGVEVVGVAANGKIAIDRLEQNPTDLLILDLEMPEMDGLQTLREIQNRGIKVKVLVFSSVSKRGAEITLEALRLGASDFIPKPGSSDFGESGDGARAIDPSTKIRNLIVPKIEAFFPNRPEHIPIQEGSKPGGDYPRILWDLFQPKVVVIGSSTGGPTVLEKIFSNISGPIRCPILMTQHMPPIFTATLAERLQRLSGIPTFEGKHDQEVKPGCAYVAPGNFHMTLKGTPENLRLQLDQGPLVNSVRPAVDNLFDSAASIFNEKCLGIVLKRLNVPEVV
jgi:two-component system, chemotaxis family, protein-glutamate methylesterase/glutaminase